MSRYPWILTEPAVRRPGDQRRGYHEGRRRRSPDACPTCGYDPIGRRKKCPACLREVRTRAA